MKIKISNDAKEKYMSFEASVELDISKSMYDGGLNATGYGANEAEARENLKLCLKELIGEFEKSEG